MFWALACYPNESSLQLGSVSPSLLLLRWLPLGLSSSASVAARPHAAASYTFLAAGEFPAPPVLPTAMRHPLAPSTLPLQPALGKP